MAEFYCDVSAVGNEYQTYAATPTWGAGATDKPLPMDGNGLSGPGHTAAVAIAEIQLTALPADGNTITIAGAVITAKTTVAAKNQFAIGVDVAATVTNIVSLINTFGTGNNQCDATVSSSVSQLLLALPYWQFARVKPGTTDTVQIATRFAGVDLNQATNANCSVATSGWGTPPTLAQFAGGANGPFAYLLNTTTIFGKAALAYGLFFAAVGSPAEPSVTTDVIHMRSMRSAANLSVNYTTASQLLATWRSRNYLADNGVVWSGDNGRLTVTLKHTGGTTTNVLTLGGGTLIFASSGDGNLEIQTGTTTTNSGPTFASMSNGAKFSFIRCRYLEESSNAASTLLVGMNNASGMYVDLSNSFTQFRGTAKGLISSVSNNGPNRIVMNGHTVEVLAASTGIGKFVDVSASAQSLSAEWIGGEIRDSNGVYRCANPFNVHPGNVSIDLTLDSVVGVTDPSVGWTPSAVTKSAFRWNSPEGANKGFRFEFPHCTVDWKGDGTFPYAGSAANLQGVNWSHRITWNSAPAREHAITALRLSRFYRSAAAVKTITLELYAPDATTFYDDELGMTVSYLDSTDVWRIETVGGARGKQFSASRTALAAGGATWTTNGVASYSAKKIALTTSYSIKQNSEVLVLFFLCQTRSPSIAFYVSPEIGVS